MTIQTRRPLVELRTTCKVMSSLWFARSNVEGQGALKSQTSRKRHSVKSWRSYSLLGYFRLDRNVVGFQWSYRNGNMA